MCSSDRFSSAVVDVQWCLHKHWNSVWCQEHLSSFCKPCSVFSVCYMDICGVEFSLTSVTLITPWSTQLFKNRNKYWVHHKVPQLVASFTLSTVKRWLLHFKKWREEISQIRKWPIQNEVLLPSLNWHRHWTEELKFELFSLSRDWDAEHMKRCWRSTDTIYQAWRTKGDGLGCSGAVKWGIYTELKGSWISKAFTSLSNTIPHIPCGWHLIGVNVVLQQDHNPKQQHGTKLSRTILWKKQSAGALSIMEASQPHPFVGDPKLFIDWVYVKMYFISKWKKMCYCHSFIHNALCKIPFELHLQNMPPGCFN